MTTTKDYRDLILEQLNLLDNITCKSMREEYLKKFFDIINKKCDFLIVSFVIIVKGEMKNSQLRIIFIKLEV